jgi:hypothetical protein
MGEKLTMIMKFTKMSEIFSHWFMQNEVSFKAIQELDGAKKNSQKA